MLILSFLVIPIVLIVRVIRPFYWIRFGWFFGSRIGHFAFDVEYYLSERKVGLHPKKALLGTKKSYLHMEKQILLLKINSWINIEDSLR